MPLVRISLGRGKPVEYLWAIADGLHQALVETMNVPTADRFQIITEHEKDTLIFDHAFLGIHRSEDLVIMQITLKQGRTPEMKQALYRRAVELLKQRPGLLPQDLLISIVETGSADWSFGNGEAQFMK